MAEGLPEPRVLKIEGQKRNVLANSHCWKYRGLQRKKKPARISFNHSNRFLTILEFVLHTIKECMFVFQHRMCILPKHEKQRFFSVILFFFSSVTWPDFLFYDEMAEFYVFFFVVRGMVGFEVAHYFQLLLQ